MMMMKAESIARVTRFISSILFGCVSEIKDEDYVEVEAKLRGRLESFLEIARSFNMIYTKEARPWTHMMDVPQLHGFGPTANCLLEAYKTLLNITWGCLLVRQSFFHGGLSLNMDVSTTMILTPGPVIDFLLANQNALEPRNIDWAKQLITPIRIEWWAVVNFSAYCDTSHLSQELINCGRKRAFQNIERPHTLVEEDPQYRRSSPIVRVEKMFEMITSKLPGHLQFLLCVLPEKKNSDSYGPWKKKSLSDFEIATQCISPTKFNDQ